MRINRLDKMAEAHEKKEAARRPPIDTKTHGFAGFFKTSIKRQTQTEGIDQVNRWISDIEQNLECLKSWVTLKAQEAIKPHFREHSGSSCATDFYEFEREHNIPPIKERNSLNPSLTYNLLSVSSKICPAQNRIISPSLLKTKNIKRLSNMIRSIGRRKERTAGSNTFRSFASPERKSNNSRIAYIKTKRSRMAERKLNVAHTSLSPFEMKLTQERPRKIKNYSQRSLNPPDTLCYSQSSTPFPVVNLHPPDLSPKKISIFDKDIVRGGMRRVNNN